jgi:hypothetical protein
MQNRRKPSINAAAAAGQPAGQRPQICVEDRQQRPSLGLDATISITYAMMMLSSI